MRCVRKNEVAGFTTAAQSNGGKPPRHKSSLATVDHHTWQGSFRTGKSAALQACSLSFAGHFLDHFARLRLPFSMASLGPSLLIIDRV
jgi:hypothetical protein